MLGDFNGFYFENAVGTLEASGLLDLHRLLPEEERYSYLFEGNLQAIDHMLVSGGLQLGATFDAVHINAEQTSTTPRGTDHDPIVGRFLIEHPNEAPVGLVIDGTNVNENVAAGTRVGTVSATDPDPEDVLSYSLVNNGDGRFAIDAATGVLTTAGAIDYETRASYDLVVRASDPDGLTVDRAITITVANVNEAPVAVADAVAVNEDATTDNLWSVLLANDTDPDAGSMLSIAAVNGTGTLGSLVFDRATQNLRYVADADTFDALAPGQTAVDSFGYTVTDAAGLTSTATVRVTVTGVADGAFSKCAKPCQRRTDRLQPNGGDLASPSIIHWDELPQLSKLPLSRREWQDDTAGWHRSYGNENWEFAVDGLMARRIASIDDLSISECERLVRWPLVRVRWATQN